MLIVKQTNNKQTTAQSYDHQCFQALLRVETKLKEHLETIMNQKVGKTTPKRGNELIWN